ncbi:MAG: WYL domain-containing protein [Microbacteriaceae bacterium]
MKRLSSDTLTFLLSLVAYLNNYRSASVHELAEYFGYSDKQIRELIPRLTTFGTPGIDGMYQHDDLFDIDWDAFEDDDLVFLTLPAGIGDVPRFSAAEATALILGLQQLQAIPEFKSTVAINTLIAKLALGSATPVRAPLMVIEDPQHEISVIRDAMAQQKVLSFDYVPADSPQKSRTVEPLALSSMNSLWYLRAWDLGALGERFFRLDRMNNVTLGAEDSERKPEDSTNEPIFNTNSAGLQTVQIQAGSNAEEILRDFQAVPSNADYYDITVAHLHNLKRVIAANAGSIRLVNPAEASAQVRNWAEAALEQYQ